MNVLCVVGEEVVKNLLVHLLVIAGQTDGNPPDEFHVLINYRFMVVFANFVTQAADTASGRRFIASIRESHVHLVLICGVVESLKEGRWSSRRGGEGGEGKGESG